MTHRDPALDYTPEMENYLPENKLTPDREAYLRQHLTQCDVPYLTCPECHELWSNIGTQDYKAILMTLPPEDREPGDI